MKYDLSKKFKLLPNTCIANWRFTEDMINLLTKYGLQLVA